VTVSETDRSKLWASIGRAKMMPRQQSEPERLACGIMKKGGVPAWWGKS
jgi:hypothetical protein